MPEGDTLHRTADGLRPYLVGRAVMAARAAGPGARPAGRPGGRRDRDRRRGRRQEPARPVRQRPRAADPPPDERLVAPLPAGRAVAPAAVPGAARPRGPGRRRGLLRRPGRRAARDPGGGPPPATGRARAGPARPGLGPRRRPPRRSAGCATRRGPSGRSAKRSSTSGRWPGSATSTRARCCSSSGSTRGPPSGSCPTRRSPRWSRPPGGSSSPTPTGAPVRSGSRRTGPGPPPVQPLWVYDRAGRPCRRCGTPIARRRQGSDLPRLTFWCPRCQGGG